MEKKRNDNEEMEIDLLELLMVDYFGLKLWKTCVKHTTNKLYNQKCQNNFRNNYSGNFIFKQLKNG